MGDEVFDGPTRRVLILRHRAPELFAELSADELDVLFCAAHPTVRAVAVQLDLNASRARPWPWRLWTLAGRDAEVVDADAQRLVGTRVHDFAVVEGAVRELPRVTVCRNLLPVDLELPGAALRVATTEPEVVIVGAINVGIEAFTGFSITSHGPHLRRSCRWK